MNGPKQTAPSRELLLANHVFPGEYIVKAFGPSNDAFREAIVSAAVSVVGEARADLSIRASRHGAKLCITLRLNALSVDEVIDVYEEIHRVDGLAMIL